MSTVVKPELLAPAGDMERLIMALRYGADAVYMAGQMFGMRAAAGNFDDDALKKAVGMCHERGVKAYITCNTVPRNGEAKLLPPFLEKLQDMGADAVIAADLGVIRLARKYAPDVRLHVSTQAGVMNSETANAFYDMGASRVILAREMTLDEIRDMRREIPDELEVEAFVHGAMCVSFSGRCLLSNYLTGRDANRGECAQPCRWKYRLIEEKRPDTPLEITEDGGTFILNSKDMCMIDHIPELIEAGVSSFKIEGRMKSFYYAAAVTNAYRRAIDFAVKGEPLPEIWRREVNKVSHRDYWTGFYYDMGGPGQVYRDAMYDSDSDVVAMVEECDADGNASLTQRNRFFRGDTLELLTPEGEPVYFTADVLTDAEGKPIETANHPMMALRMKLPKYAPPLSIIRKDRK